MPLYMLNASYTAESWAAMTKNPQDRAVAVRPAIEALGGKLLSVYFTFGPDDLIAIVEMPDNVSAAAFSIAAAAGGGVKSLRTTPLMTTEEAMKAMSKAGGSSYKPPK